MTSTTGSVAAENRACPYYSDGGSRQGNALPYPTEIVTISDATLLARSCLSYDVGADFEGWSRSISDLASWIGGSESG